jgi:hypothetical protein
VGKKGCALGCEGKKRGGRNELTKGRRKGKDNLIGRSQVACSRIEAAHLLIQRREEGE